MTSIAKPAESSVVASLSTKPSEPNGNSAYFSLKSLQFLEELREHNQREWFERNRARYETQLRDPFLNLIADLAAPLKRISPDFVADPRPTGGSMMRIYRDIRFARDKRPYKTSLAAHFRYAKGKDGATPAYYLHVEPGRSMIGGGLWRPSAFALGKVREAIVAEPESWRRVTSGADFCSSCGMTGESLKKAPRGYDPSHPLIEDLKRKDFAVSSALNDGQVTSPELFEAITDAFRIAAPFVEFLIKAVEAP
jgi:uncharacterized protein (TIGR02453 family)